MSGVARGALIRIPVLVWVPTRLEVRREEAELPEEPSVEAPMVLPSCSRREELRRS